jgi:hypothetical protein
MIRYIEDEQHTEAYPNNKGISSGQVVCAGCGCTLVLPSESSVGEASTMQRSDQPNPKMQLPSPYSAGARTIQIPGDKGAVRRTC